MNKQEQLDLVRAKCIEANPEQLTPSDISSIPDRPIRLADVLLAMNFNGQKSEGMYYGCMGNGALVSLDGEGDGRLNYDGPQWNLVKDDLTEQSDECINFLAELLQGHEEKN